MENGNGRTAPASPKAPPRLEEQLNIIFEAVIELKDISKLTRPEITHKMQSLSEALRNAEDICTIIRGKKLALQTECRKRGKHNRSENSTLCQTCFAYLGINLDRRSSPIIAYKIVLKKKTKRKLRIKRRIISSKRMKSQ